MARGRFVAQAGFTLIELMIAVAILALLMTLLFGGLRLATHQLERRSERLDRSSRVAQVQDFLRVELGDARPLTVDGTLEMPVLFDGRASELEFVGLAPESAVGRAMQVFAVAFVKVDAKAAGELRLRSRSYGTPEAAGGHDSLLLDGVRSAAFAYFGVMAREDQPSWHSTWQGMRYFPALIRLSLTFADGQSMPDLVIALRLSQDPALRQATPVQH